MVFCLGLAPKKRKKRMSDDDVMVFLGFWALLGFLLFQVGRSNEILLPGHVVVGPLTGKWEDEYSASLLLFGGGALSFAVGMLTTPRKNKEFDSTMGFPGEDVQPPLPFIPEFSFSLLSWCSNCM